MMSANSERYAGLDALRASMMLLGVVLHSATAYCTFPNVWWLKDPTTSRAMDFLVLWIHIFRLPVFFVMAGFFAAMLVAKRGCGAFIENRTARLFLPLLAGMFAIYPLLRCVSVYFWYEQRGGSGWVELSRWYHSGKLANDIEPAHFWFLQVLLYLSLAGAPLAGLINKVLGKRWFRMAVSSPGAPLLFALPTFISLMPMSMGILDTPHDFTPPFRIFAAYAVFYSFGWGLWLHRDMLGELRRGGWVYVAATVPLAGLILGAFDPTPRQPLVVAALNALAAWMMIFGLLAVFLRSKSFESPRWRYLSDAAYYVYLVHPVALVIVEIPLMTMPISPVVKFIGGILVSVPALLWSYDRWVRATWIGVMLNGRRYERFYATISTANAAKHAVSALRMRGPKDTAVQPAAEA